MQSVLPTKLRTNFTRTHNLKLRPILTLYEGVLQKEQRKSPRVNFTNVLLTAFMQADPKSTKNNVKHVISLLGSWKVNVEHKILVKLTPGAKAAN